MGPPACTLVAVFLCVVLGPGGVEGYRVGDFIPTARRAQYSSARTTWHDLLGRHCPRFGTDGTAVLPLPNPSGVQNIKEYKIELSFAHEAHLTSWVTVLSPRIDYVPLLDVTLTRSGTEIKRVRASVRRVPDAYVEAHSEDLVPEWKDNAVWPKHLLVQYTWVVETDVDGEAGLFTLILLSLLAGIALTLHVVSTHGDKFQDFVEAVQTGGDLDGGIALAPPAQQAVMEGDRPMQPRRVPVASGPKAD